MELPLWLVQKLPVWWKARRVRRMLRGAIRSGTLTINEARAIFGLPPFERD